MKTHYRASYTAPAMGEPFEVVEAFRHIQLRHFPRWESQARIMSESLQTVAIPDAGAVEILAEWNRQAQGRIVYSLAENPLTV